MSQTIQDPARWQDTERRILELELLQVRREADAARLEARAAELERMIQQLWLDTERQRNSHSLIASTPHEASSRGTRSTADQPSISHQPASTNLRTGKPTERRERKPTALHDTPPKLASPAPDRATSPAPDRVVAPAARRAASPATNPVTAVTLKSTDTRGRQKPAAPPVRRKQPNAKPSPTPAAPSELTDRVVSSRLALPSNSRRRRALLVSAVVHVLLLMALALVGLKLQKPKDQIHFSASVSSSESNPMDTFSIESVEPTAEPEQLAESETEDVELSPIGEMESSQLTLPDALSADASAMSTLSQSTAQAETLNSKPVAEPVAFCGVEGGGNHVVYLVDSSKSMGQAFASARDELLRSIQALSPEQRFYVIFFDADPDYMRVSNPDADEPRSLLATPANKAALQQWAMNIRMDEGRAPYDPLQFALALKPEVIFLLSDGEFPERIESLLGEENRVENLFGDQQRISIVHTIGYHSRQGEDRMRRIAEQNGGKYRHVPKP